MANALDIAREYFPNMSEPDLGYLLWNETAFPCCDEVYLREQLAKLRSKLKTGKLDANKN
jgi:hypothetical protein